MFSRNLFFVSLLLVLLVIGTEGFSQEKLRFRKPPSPGVIELVTDVSTVVELKDGSLLANNGRISTDGGRTWSERRPFGKDITGQGLIRLQSGALALTLTSPEPKLWISMDEGKTWESRVPRLVGIPHDGALIQLKSGRLIWPSRECFGNTFQPERYPAGNAFGTWRGQRANLEGHGHHPEVSIAGVSRSDDEGKTWLVGEKNRPDDDERRYSSAILFGWFGPEGHLTESGGWVTDCDEPTAAETKDGKVLVFCRSTVGRIVQSFSLDGGIHWTPLLPADLANSYSPARLVRIPKTGDLMCVWNQVSGEEIRRGYRRGRLTAAISKDGGHTWENFKTLELSAGLDDVDRVQPEYPIPMVVRARKDVGPVPDDFAAFHYAQVSFVGDKVFIAYSRTGLRVGNVEANFENQGHVLRIYPLEWFHK